MLLSFKYFLIISGLIVSGTLSAQLNISGLSDFGKNNVSEGIFLNSSILSNYQLDKNSIEFASQFNIISNTKRIFSSMYVKAARDLNLKNFPFTIQGFYLYNNFSELLFEYNYGGLIQIKRNRYIIKIGTNFKTYGINKQAQNNYQIESNTTLHENWDLMYAAYVFLKQKDNKYNLGLGVSNFDYFIINQKSNPVININGNYYLNPEINLFVELWMKSSGAFNMSVNYFGFLFRTGLTWEIDL